MVSALPKLGVIEGFYGVTWSQHERLTLIDFLADNGFSSYCYAPKSDVNLRSQWHQNWAHDQFEALLQVADYARDKRVEFSVGLTPLDLHKDWGNPQQRKKLLSRLQQIKALKPASVSLLFDDMWGDVPGLAALQVDITHFVADVLNIPLTICPSYYTFDPVLEQLFGTRPSRYWQDLGSGLDSSIQCYWTGDRVISEEYHAQGLQDIAEYLQRKPVIWDNSRVNDGRKTSPFLPVKAMPDISAIAQYSAGFVVNPMNAAALARLVMQTLVQEGSAGRRLEPALQSQCPDFAVQLQQILPSLSDTGLSALNPQQRAELTSFCRSNPHPVTADIENWLVGKFIFDPACLT